MNGANPHGNCTPFMSERVALRASAASPALAWGTRAFIAGIASGASGITPITRFDTADCRSHSAAAIHDFDPAAFIAPLKLRRVDAVGRVALACTRLLFEDAGCDPAPAAATMWGWRSGRRPQVSTASPSILGGLTDHGPPGVSAILFSNTVANAPASLCAIEFGLRGPNVTFNQREASSLSALAFSVGAIRDGRTTAMVTGGADCLEETFFKSARSVPCAVADARIARRRRGGTAVRSHQKRLRSRRRWISAVDRAASAAAARGARVYGEIVGIGATASTAPLNGWPADGAGLANAMRLALADANVRDEDVGGGDRRRRTDRPRSIGWKPARSRKCSAAGRFPWPR